MKRLIQLCGIFVILATIYAVYKAYMKKVEWWKNEEYADDVEDDCTTYGDSTKQTEPTQFVESVDVLGGAHLEGEPLPCETEKSYYVLNTKTGKIHKSTCRLIVKHLTNASYKVISDLGRAKAEGATLCSNCML